VLTSLPPAHAGDWPRSPRRQARPRHRHGGRTRRGRAIVLAEIVILGAGVTARYVFHAPLVWSDELASILFLWLSMLGAVVALRRGEHMRMTGLVTRVGPQARLLLEALAHHRRDRLPGDDPSGRAGLRRGRAFHRHARAGDRQ
jgi:hypothetical protein